MKDEKTVTMPKQEYDNLLEELECLKGFKEEFSKDKIVKACMLKRDYINYGAMWGHPNISRVVPEKELEIVDPGVIDKEILQMNCSMQEKLAELVSELERKEKLYESFKKDLEDRDGAIGKLNGENAKLQHRNRELRYRIDIANARGLVGRIIFKRV